MTRLLYGKEIADKRIPELADRAKTLRGKGVLPCLSILRAGNRDDDIAYERSIVRFAEKVGIDVRCNVVSAEADNVRLLEQIALLNADPTVHGVLIFRPLPSHMDDAAVCAALDPRKDVDGITPASMAALYAGGFSGLRAGFAPCTAEAVIDVLDHFGIEISGKRAVIIGRSAVIGRPAALLLLSRDATVTICHRKTANIAGIAAEADILVVAAGLASRSRSDSVGRAYFNAEQTVIDVGIHADAEGKLYGDVNAEEAMNTAANFTPVPGGVGTVTTLKLLEHTIQAAEAQHGGDD